MPAPAPTSFASAAASSSNNENGTPGRSVGGSGDWSRTRSNGATQTFRRPSQINTPSYSKDTSQPFTSTPTSGAYVPPHLNSNYHSAYNRSSTTGDLRYSKEQLLEIFKSQEESSMTNGQLQNALTEGWTPRAFSGNNREEWGRRDETRDNQNNPDICWDFDGSVQPISLAQMTEEERELFSSSVNSPLKGPTQSATKEGMPSAGLNGRKPSVSHGQGGAGSTLQGRPGARRRDTSDSTSGNPLATPSGFGRQTRDDAPLTTPPSSLFSRRRTDFKEGNTGSPFDKTRLDTAIDTTSPFGSWKRNISGPMSAGVTGPSSPWASTGPQSAGFGAFGNFSIDNAGATPSTPAEKRVGFGSVRGESRFKGLMGRDSSEDISGKSKEKPYMGLEKLAETEMEGRGTRSSDTQKKSSFFGDEERIGSAALGGDEPSPPLQYGANVDQKRTHDEIGFASLNTPSSLGAIRDFVGRRDFTSQEKSQIHHMSDQGQEPMSPTDTNPYQSPDPEKPMDDDTDDENRRTPFSLRSQSSKPLISAYDGDRSQTSSTGQQRPFPGLGGPLGSLGGVSNSGPWSTAPGAIGQQSRAGQGFGSAFPESLFGPMTDLSSPGAFATPTSSAFAPRSKMNSLFPGQMQDNMRNNETRNEAAFSDPRDIFTNAPREPEAPPQSNRVLNDFFSSADDLRSDPSMIASPFPVSEGAQTLHSQYSTTESPQTQSTQTGAAATSISTPSAVGGSSLLGRSPEAETGAGQPPPAQQRRMVMPDRMRWIYRDPSGNTQGPFSGLDMHDWYKAGFFSPELQVKKVEDSDYEPLAHLIRRIGNSREPFLVPQIGIPHGQPSESGVLGAVATGAPPPTGQPPFGNSFPSFGTTLTADQQNALERRKQEEQFLMARQKEHLAQQQAYMKQVQMSSMPMHPQQLHHHSSAHSLQSQPSYGSIASPGGFQAAPGQLPAPPSVANMGFFDPAVRPGFSSQGPSGDGLTTPREAMLPGVDRLNLGPPGQNTFGGMPRPQEGYNHQQQVTGMMQDRARLQVQQKQWESMHKGDGRENVDRLEQFNQLRAQEDERVVRPPSGPIARPTNLDAIDFTEQQLAHDLAFLQQGQPQAELPTYNQSQQTTRDIAPQPPTSPLPAPAAQRSRQQFAEVLAVESGSRPQSPIDTPTTASLAPWAKENVEPSKGPSLKEIQEAEARKTSQREEVVAAARRAAVEQERIAAAQASIQAPAPGLPSSANWAASSPVTSSSGPVPWAKPTVGKTAAPPSSTKKSIAQIQKEEEARKNRAAAAAAAAASANAATTANTSGGKRYADLASKVTAPVLPVSASGAGAWTTVGASGKAKAPASPALPSSTPQRTGSGSGQLSGAASITKSKSAVPARSNASAISAQSAHDEFQKWVKNSLGKGLSSGVNVDDFVRNLLQLPPELEILSEAIYGNSTTLDGHRFAEEFVRRRKQADKGIAPETSAGGNFSSGGGDNSKGSSGGWSEVAKKVPSSTAREEPNSPFKVVAAKKKSKR